MLGGRRSCSLIYHVCKIITETLLLLVRISILLMWVRISHWTTSRLIGTTKSSLVHAIIPWIRSSLSFMRWGMAFPWRSSRGYVWRPHATLFEFNLQSFTKRLLPIYDFNCHLSWVLIIVWYETKSLGSSIFFVCHNSNWDDFSQMKSIKEAK